MASPQTLPRGAALVLTVLVVGYGACLLIFVQSSLPARSPPQPQILLRPFGDGLESAREVRAQVGGAHLRRLCASGRCELLAARSAGEGFSLLASYPADRWVGLDIDAAGEPILRAITDGPPDAAPERPLTEASAYGALLLGLLALGLLARARGGLGEALGRYVAARPALVTDAGTLRFLDAASPATGHTTRPLVPGAATALCEVRRLDEPGPYRERGTLWLAVPGARHEAIARLAALRGALGALGFGVALSGALAVLIAVA